MNDHFGRNETDTLLKEPDIVFESQRLKKAFGVILTRSVPESTWRR
jgi:hypothetical protein